MAVFLFLDEPVLHVFGFALALEVELDIVEGCDDFLEGRLWGEIGVANGQHIP